MHRSLRWVLALLLCTLALSSATTEVASATGNVSTHAACGAAPAGSARCLAQIRSVRSGLTPLVTSSAPTGYGPADLRNAYKLPATGGAGQTVAIVDAYGYPSAEHDLAAYRSHYRLPACTVASGCLRIVNQAGANSPLPAADHGWAAEMALDLDAASAACPGCRLLLVQATSSSFDDLATAVNTAVRLGATVVSNSYGNNESAAVLTDAAAYNHPGIPILVSSGDSGFTAASYPAVLSSVIAVGGTSLKRANNARGWTESAWSGAGSGCSAWVAKPAWQHDSHCAMRTTSDISADADPATGFAVYDSYGYDGQYGWLEIGGTSASAPFLAGVIALAGRPSAVTPRHLYAEPHRFFDAVGGSTGYCGNDYLCTGLPGYDGPTGLGSPDGLTAFR